MSAPSVVARPSERMVQDPDRLRRFSVADYHKMIAAGILTSRDRVELLEGWIVGKMPQNPPHISSVTRIMRRLAQVLPENWTLRVQGPITLSDSEPEPDIALARGAEDTYDARHPEPADLGIVMEVGDATVLADRRYKSGLYAKAKIAEFWLIDLVERKLEVCTKPRGGKYTKLVEYAASDLVPLVLDGVRIAKIPVGELLVKAR